MAMLPTCSTFQKFITTVAGKCEFDLQGEPHKTLIVANPTSYIAGLMISQHAKNILYISQRLDDGRDDPGVTIFTGYAGGWTAIGISQLFPGHYRLYATVKPDLSKLDQYRGLPLWKDLNSFCNGFWVSALREQGFGKAKKFESSVWENIAVEDVELFYRWDEEG